MWSWKVCSGEGIATSVYNWLWVGPEDDVNHAIATLLQRRGVVNLIACFEESLLIPFVE